MTMTKTSTGMLALLTGLFFCTFVESVLAQAPRGGKKGFSRPTRPALSPMLGLTQPSFGELPSYQMFVQPRQEAYRQALNQWAQANRTDSLARSFQSAMEDGPAGIDRATGNASSFQNYLHYYPQMNRNAARNQR